MRTPSKSRFSHRLAMLVGALALAAAAPVAVAQHRGGSYGDHHGGYHDGYRGGYHGGHHGEGRFLAGALTATIIGGLIYDSTRPTTVYDNSYYTQPYYAPPTYYAPQPYYPPGTVIYNPPPYPTYYPAPVIYRHPVYRRW